MNLQTLNSILEHVLQAHSEDRVEIIGTKDGQWELLINNKLVMVPIPEIRYMKFSILSRELRVNRTDDIAGLISNAIKMCKKQLGLEPNEWCGHLAYREFLSHPFMDQVECQIVAQTVDLRKLIHDEMFMEKFLDGLND